MGTISRRRYDTGNSFSNGFPMFPAGSTPNGPRTPREIGIGGINNRSFPPFIDVDMPLAFFRFQASCSTQTVAAAFFGFLLGYTAEGETRNDGTATLRVSSESMRGGLGIGLGATFALSLRLDRVDLAQPIGDPRRWANLTSLTFSTTADVIELVLYILARVGGIPVFDKLSDLNLPGNYAIWGLFDSTSSTGGGSGFLTGNSPAIRPRQTISVNILQILPKIGAVIKAFKEVGIKMSIGPTFILFFPITIKIVRLVTEDGTYEVTSARRTTPTVSTFEFRGGRVGNLPPTVSQAAVTHEHGVGLSFGIEIRASLGFLKLLSLSHAVPLPLTNLLQTSVPIFPNRPTVPFYTAFPSGTPIPPTAREEMPLPEVVWG